jgi:hypothetical protein
MKREIVFEKACPTRILTPKVEKHGPLHAMGLQYIWGFEQNKASNTSVGGTGHKYPFDEVSWWIFLSVIE